MTLHEFEPDVGIRCRDYAIGCIGAGFIMADVHLAAYADAGFTVRAIASRTLAKAQAAADRWKIPQVHDTPAALLADASIDIVDLAYPPHLQAALIEAACRQPHIKAILAQKPLAPTYAEARAVVECCERAGKVLSVNQNMRYDQSMRVLRQILDRGLLGTPVVASIDMRAIPHWQSYLDDYERLTLLNMSVHHLDIMRYLFGEVADIYVGTRRDPRRTKNVPLDGICISTLRFESGVIGSCLDDVWASPTGPDFESDTYIRWRVEGEQGVARGTIGWPDYPAGSPSTLEWCAPATGGKWQRPRWETMWFPHAFRGVMEQLQYALRTGTPPTLSARDNLKTMALVEAGYRSIVERRAVAPAEILSA
jgi:predicted dehydrogenase